MREEVLTTLVNDFMRKSYVDIAMLVTRVGIPMAGKPPSNVPVEVFTTMAGVTYGGAEEMVGPPKERLKDVRLNLDGNKKIILKGISNLYILVIMVKEYNEEVEKDITDFSETVSKSI
jgi:predicted regulator of Ras-like GTPase activity (Roadblock/LC7/MglB family)